MRDRGSQARELVLREACCRGGQTLQEVDEGVDVELAGEGRVLREGAERGLQEGEALLGVFGVEVGDVGAGGGRGGGGDGAVVMLCVRELEGMEGLR